MSQSIHNTQTPKKERVNRVPNISKSESHNSVDKLILRRPSEHNDTKASNNSNDSGRIIIVSHNYAPLLNPRAFRWTAIAEQWAKQGKQVDVVCAWEDGLPSVYTKKGVKIHRVGAGAFESIRLLLRDKKRSFHADKESASALNDTHEKAPSFSRLIKGAKSTIKSAIKIAHDLTWKNIYWPDYATLWSKPATKKVNEILSGIGSNDNNITLITVSDPFTSHVAGKALKAQWPTLNWVIDIGDPFCFRHDIPTNNHALYRAYNYKYESKILAEADSISVTTESTKRKYCELFPSIGSKIKVIPPLVTVTENPSNESPLGESAAFKVLFTGALYRKIRNPEYLLRLFSELHKRANSQSFELHFFGPSDDCKAIFAKYHSRLKNVIHLHGLQSKSKTISAMHQADLLVNIGNTNPYQLPSKVVEYASSSKPILNIASIANDSSAEFFANRPNTLTLSSANSESFNGQVSLLSIFIESSTDRIPENYQKEIVATHSTETITAQYEALLVRVS